MASPTTTRDCPCGSGLRYRACCKPLHDGQKTAPTPEALMRSRYAAFALGHGGYLYDTLASTHPDRAVGAHEVRSHARDTEGSAAAREIAVRELSRMREQQRFLKLTILFSTSASGDTRKGEEGNGGKEEEGGEGEEGEVLFFARIFEKGQDRSFAELSHFIIEDGAWRYESGVLVPRDRLPEDDDDLSTLTRERFLELASSMDR